MGLRSLYDLGRTNSALTASMNASTTSAVRDNIGPAAGAAVAAAVANTTAFEVPPPGPGETTVMLALPAAATSVAGIKARSSVGDTNVVALGDPLKFTTEALTKFVPVTMSVNAAAPAVMELGLMLVMVGAGLLTVAAAVADAPPRTAGVVAVMVTGPPAARPVRVMDAEVDPAATVTVAGTESRAGWDEVTAMVVLLACGAPMVTVMLAVLPTVIV